MSCVFKCISGFHIMIIDDGSVTKSLPKAQRPQGLSSYQSRATETVVQGCISCGTCSYPELTEDHVLTSTYVKILRTVTRNAVNKSV